MPCGLGHAIIAGLSQQSQASQPMWDLLQTKRHSPALIPNSLATNAVQSEQLTSLNKIFLTLHRYKAHGISGPYHFVTSCHIKIGSPREPAATTMSQTGCYMDVSFLMCLLQKMYNYMNFSE